MTRNRGATSGVRPAAGRSSGSGRLGEERLATALPRDAGSSPVPAHPAFWAALPRPISMGGRYAVREYVHRGVARHVLHVLFGFRKAYDAQREQEARER